MCLILKVTSFLNLALHCTKLMTVFIEYWTYLFYLLGSRSEEGKSIAYSAMYCHITVDCMGDMYRAPQIYLLDIYAIYHYHYCCFTGDSLFSNFFPLESIPFFFLFARSWGSLRSSGTWWPLEGLIGLIVPGRRGRTIGDGARTGVVMLLAVSVFSAVTWGDKWWGGLEAGG